MELALEGGEPSLLALLSVDVRVYDDASVSKSWPALMAFSKADVLTAVDFLLVF